MSLKPETVERRIRALELAVRDLHRMVHRLERGYISPAQIAKDLDGNP